VHENETFLNKKGMVHGKVKNMLKYKNCYEHMKCFYKKLIPLATTQKLAFSSKKVRFCEKSATNFQANENFCL